MKKLLIVMSIMTLVSSCTKTLDTQSISSSVSSEAVLHDNYSETLPLSYLDISPCTNEAINVTGEVRIRGRYLVNNGTIRFTGTTRYRKMIGTGVVTGELYNYDQRITEKSTVDVLGSTAHPQGTFILRGRFLIKHKESTAVTTFSFKWNVDFNTMVYVYDKAEVASYCK